MKSQIRARLISLHYEIESLINAGSAYLNDNADAIEEFLDIVGDALDDLPYAEED